MQLQKIKVDALKLSDIKNPSEQKIHGHEEIDTIICSAREYGFKSVFLDKKQWYSIRISSGLLPKLKYLAIYEVSPVSAIRWAGKIEKIEKYEGGPKYILYLSEIFQVGPVKADSQKFAPQGSRFTCFDILSTATKISEIF